MLLTKYFFMFQIYIPQISYIYQQVKPGFHIIAPIATITALVEKRVSVTVAIYRNTLFNDSSDGNNSRRWDRKISILVIVVTIAMVYFVNGNHLKF